jgi:HPt (histidine-containing phosphotransfer) domain-containing protein
MDELKELYRQALPPRIEALESARRDAAASPEEASRAVRRLAHSLRGSGGTYGFPEVTRAAALVEAAPPERLTQALDELLATLRAVAAGEDGA